jgi:transcription-repair coupling factor (superfamily II helicase)
VLVCTTIVESGLDIPSANTLIVERADELGLAQLYQIRGPRRAARASAPTRTCSTRRRPRSPRRPGQRLATLSDYTELGSGFKIAMRDLEIRGAGNLLGDEQSGHVAAVGFELYVGMIDEAVRLLAGRRRRRGGRARAHGPAGGRLRARATTCPTRRPRSRSTAAWPGAREVAQLIMLREELADRFGPIPPPLDNLIRLQDARIKLGRAGARSVGFTASACRSRRSSSTRPGRRRCASGVPDAMYESGRETVRVTAPGRGG